MIHKLLSQKNNFFEVELTPIRMAYGFAGILGVEAGLTLYDFVTEDRTRLLPWTERVTHTLLTLNFGAILALWLPVIFSINCIFFNCYFFFLYHSHLLIRRLGFITNRN